MSLHMEHLELRLAQNRCPVGVSCCHMRISEERASGCKLVKNGVLQRMNAPILSCLQYHCRRADLRKKLDRKRVPGGWLECVTQTGLDSCHSTCFFIPSVVFTGLNSSCVELCFRHV